MSNCLRFCSSESHLLSDPAVNLNGWAGDNDKMQVSPKTNLWYDTDAVSTRLTPYDLQCEQKLLLLVSFITVWRSLPHSSVQVAEWQSGRTDHVCVKTQQLSLSFSLFLSLVRSLTPSSLFKQTAVALFVLYLKVVGYQTTRWLPTCTLNESWVLYVFIYLFMYSFRKYIHIQNSRNGQWTPYILNFNELD